jgi:hypothetical protein
MDNSRTALAGLNALVEAERREAREARRALFRRRLVAAADIDPEALSLQARRVLDWLAEWDFDWLAEWDEPTTEGLVEILGTVRTAAQVTEHRAELDHKVAALRRSEAATEAALARYDDRWGAAR